MGTTDNGGAAGGDRSRFRCRECGERELSTAVEYDDLGYPLCPACGVTEGPAEEPVLGVLYG